jgi:hypothetical protein
MSKKMTREEMKELLKALEEAFDDAGRKIETALLFDEDLEGELVIDNRDKTTLH